MENIKMYAKSTKRGEQQKENGNGQEKELERKRQAVGVTGRLFK